ncbi:YebG family protein [Rouxiella chamberiensis]|uniref:YebG family protein n=1 Tax=Rouxiella chamberiensis TaxID=1513468 RepID=A0ABY7HQG5_9GAMM|nr:YebG family protein [Rouxiella chamberiensis]WAT01634.1 YebG family protein [Rouxiella chamberiensis]
MAVETKFVVVRKGEEKMTFASKKEADAYDKMLDMAEAFTDWLLESKLQLDEEQAENMALFLAEQKDAVQHILRTSKVPDANRGFRTVRCRESVCCRNRRAKSGCSQGQCRRKRQENPRSQSGVIHSALLK